MISIREQPKVTIGFYPRERYSKAPEALSVILKHTKIPFKLIIVDCDTPKRIWDEMENLIAHLHYVEVIGSDKYMLPAACRSAIFENAETEYLCLIENDVLIEDGLVEKLLRTAGEHRADVVVPMIFETYEGRPEIKPNPHFDDNLGSLHTVETREGTKLEILPRNTSRFSDPESSVRREQFMEQHCLFFRTSLVKRMPPLDGTANAGDDIDMSMAVREGGGEVFFDPGCKVNFVQPCFPLPVEDRRYFEMRWDPSEAEESHRRIAKRWNLTRVPQQLGFVHERYARSKLELGLWRKELETLANGQAVVIVDGPQFLGAELANKEPQPLLEVLYTGNPENDDLAIAEVERLRLTGTRILAFKWETYWCLDMYPKFSMYLSKYFCRVVNDDRMIAFDLATKANTH